MILKFPTVEPPCQHIIRIFCKWSSFSNKNTPTEIFQEYVDRDGKHEEMV